jgi:UDP-N-acetylglucosamine 2-epimerase (non-hydrolysing)
MMLKIANIVGARPNFMKIAPIHRLMQSQHGFSPFLIHTGQHYDEKMSQTFFKELGMPEPDLYLGVGSGSHARQTAAIMIELEKIFFEQRPDRIVVVGDVNSTLAASLVAVKLHIPVAHVEAGLRSFDRTMPEEINRILTDSVSDLMFVSEKSGLTNLKNEGFSSDKIHLVGNVMIDSLIEHLDKAEASTILDDLGIKSEDYALMTLHRPSNVDDEKVLRDIVSALEVITTNLPVIFPIHPRALKMLQEFKLDQDIRRLNNLFLLEPLGYLTFLKLMRYARLILTDSGGIQEETTYLKVPCLTLRQNTERPVTIELGTNRLVGSSKEDIISAVETIISGDGVTGETPPLWDGKSAARIVEILSQFNG